MSSIDWTNLDDRKEISFLRIGDNFAETLRNQARKELLLRSHKNEREGVREMAKWIHQIREKISSPTFFYECAEKGQMSHTFFPKAESPTTTPLFSFMNGETCADGGSRWNMGEYFIYILGKVCYELGEERVTSLADLIHLPLQLRGTFTVKTNWTHKKADCATPNKPIDWNVAYYRVLTEPEIPPEPFIIISWKDSMSNVKKAIPTETIISSPCSCCAKAATNTITSLRCFNEFDSITHL